MSEPGEIMGEVGDEISLQSPKVWTFCGSGAPSFALGQEVERETGKGTTEIDSVLRGEGKGLGPGAGTLASTLQSCPKKTEDFPVPDRPALCQSI